MKSSETSLKIADIPIALISDIPLASQVRESFDRFLADDPPQYTLNIKLSHKPLHTPGVCRALKDDIFIFSSEEFNGKVDLCERRGELVVSDSWPMAAIASFLKNFSGALVLREGGLMLHAAAIERDGGAYIFFGPSGSGKTTVSEASKGCTVLTDELVIIRRTQYGFTAYGTPTWRDGIAGTGGSYPIKGLFKLVKDKEVFLKPLSPQISVAQTFTMPGFCDSLIRIEKLLEAFSNLTKEVGCYELHFLPDDSFWRSIDGHFKKMP
jgi:hypothetical protein